MVHHLFNIDSILSFITLVSTAPKKIKVKGAIVDMDGDEMTR